MHHLNAILLDLRVSETLVGNINNVSSTICQGKGEYKLTRANYLLDIITCNY